MASLARELFLIPCMLSCCGVAYENVFSKPTDETSFKRFVEDVKAFLTENRWQLDKNLNLVIKSTDGCSFDNYEEFNEYFGGQASLRLVISFEVDDNQIDKKILNYRFGYVFGNDESANMQYFFAKSDQPMINFLYNNRHIRKIDSKCHTRDGNCEFRFHSGTNDMAVLIAQPESTNCKLATLKRETEFQGRIWKLNFDKSHGAVTGPYGKSIFFLFSDVNSKVEHSWEPNRVFVKYKIQEDHSDEPGRYRPRAIDITRIGNDNVHINNNNNNNRNNQRQRQRRQNQRGIFSFQDDDRNSSRGRRDSRGKRGGKRGGGRSRGRKMSPVRVQRRSPRAYRHGQQPGQQRQPNGRGMRGNNNGNNNNNNNNRNYRGNRRHGRGILPNIPEWLQDTDRQIEQRQRSGETYFDGKYMNIDFIGTIDSIDKLHNRLHKGYIRRREKIVKGGRSKSDLIVFYFKHFRNNKENLSYPIARQGAEVVFKLGECRVYNRNKLLRFKFAYDIRLKPQGGLNIQERLRSKDYLRGTVVRAPNVYVAPQNSNSNSNSSGQRRKNINAFRQDAANFGWIHCEKTNGMYVVKPGDQRLFKDSVVFFKPSS